MRQELPSRLENIPLFLAQCLQYLNSASLPESDIFDIRISLEEAIVNAMKHGNRFDPARTVDISLEIFPSRVVAEVTDKGVGFDHAMIPDPTHQDNLKKPSGRGVFLIKQLMDEVEFFDCGRTIKMIKFIKQGGAHDTTGKS
ncbi:MAG: ATP-binding protein [Candidatus Omnitrophota bacterium]|nr:ATP-binding protein [Candidatus Omnitrophota bacterium]